MLDPSIRGDFFILSQKVNKKPLIYFDNCATSQKPKQVIDAISKYYCTTNANIHRGIHYLSEKSTNAYEESKKKVAKFIGASDAGEIIYTRNATEAINLVVYSFAQASFKEGDLIISTEMEHHSNIVPWQLLVKSAGIKLEYIPVKDDYSLDLEVYKKLLKKKPKLITFVHASNVIGTVNPALEMTRMAHKAGAKVLIDGAQSAPHIKIDVKKLDCDFFVLSAHKMLGPTGIGVLYGKRALLEKMEPYQGGGDMIDKVTLRKSTWNKLPYKYEAGTPNIAGGIAFGETIDYLENVGMKKIAKHERELVSYTLGKLNKMDEFELFGQDDSVEERGGMIAFNLKCAHPHDIAQILNDEGIAVRSGHHCAQPLHSRFKKSASARASFYIYNTCEEVDRFINALDKVIHTFT